MDELRATKAGAASRVGGTRLIGLLLLVACCTVLRGPEFRLYTAPAPSPDERYCAWFADRAGDTLYFGQSAFWAASHGGDDPLGDLAHAGPVLVGRFDLAEERLLDPLEVGRPGDRAGVWDVLAHPNGRVYFTRYFEPAGWVDPATGAVTQLPELGQGLNELAMAPDGRIFVSRYPAPDGTAGALLVLDEDGALLAEHPLQGPDGYLAAPKSVAVEPRRGRVWLTMDLLPADRHSAAPVRHDAYVLDADGALLRRIARPHIQFVAFARDGTGYLAEADRGVLFLRVVPPRSDPLDPHAGTRIRLDPDFAEDLDFAQELRPLAAGGAVVTRWSGKVHVVGLRGRVQSLAFPVGEEAGLYYSAVLREGRVCATRCADVSVVCTQAGAPR